ncbi:NAD(P)H-dependent oxidoreductase [Hymenobacter sp. J193]|uniref:NADPH-dependent FMN reductase n=1 Tax=Hymenobacter sp. J193 TaxID=2898429 RepID=UPI002151F153|nr:NADPH-dependent FMN reductase [Hymenobacter sp. J193]MCR5886765.1 NAD(P)H-dependent oxidoreductase [Hymenobacter sp. J193]
MHILAISGSLRAASSNTALLRAAALLAPVGVVISLGPSLAELPYFQPGNYDEPGAPAVAAFRELVRRADAVLFCTPEYVFSMPGVLKNALEWLVPSGELYHKPVAVWSASPGTTGADQAHAGLTAMLRVMEAAVNEAAALQVGQVSGKVNAQGEITDTELAESLRTAVAALAQAGNTTNSAYQATQGIQT